MITTLLTLTLLGQAASSSVTIQTGGSCAVQSTSRGDTLLHPTTGSDERFFSRPNGAPNILFLVDTSAGAMGWAVPLPTADGCGDPNFGDGYDPLAQYEPVIKKVDATNWPLSTGDYNADWFRELRVYELPASGNMGTNLKDAPTVTQWSTQLDACLAAADPVTCNLCLPLKGYYKGTVGGTNRVIALGRFLNYSGPKYVQVSGVLSALVRDVQNVRFGIITSHKWDSKEWSDGSGADPLINMSMMEPFWPSCSKMFGSDKKFASGDTAPQRNSVLNNISNDSNADFTGDNSLSTMLYGAGWYYASRSPFPPQAYPGSASSWPGPKDNTSKWEEGGSNQKSVCDACVYSSIIVINASAVDETKDLKLTLPGFATTIGGAPAPNCDSSTNGRCNSKADELAAWLYRNDFRADYGGIQRVSTYVVNVHAGNNTADLLRNVARMGGGQYFAATNKNNLKQAVLDAIADISNRGQTFATSAVTSIQTGQLSLTQLVPRMYPQRNLPWNGELYRFAQRNEFVLEIDLNGDGDQSDVFVVDADEDVVIESSDGYFKKAGSYASLSSSLTDGGITADARPYWEASRVLADAGWSGRTIWTVVDRNDTRASFTHEDRFVEFDKANWQELIHTLGLEKAKCPNGTNRGDIFEKLNLNVATAYVMVGMGSLPVTDAARWELCAKVVIDWVKGRDIGDEDSDGDRDESRPSMLADVFHSSPVVVEPPVERFLCDLGISNQCSKTLYTDSLPIAPATQLDTTGNFNDPICDKADGTDIQWSDPYDIWRARQRARDRLVIVGSNGGMLHAFNNGKLISQTCSGVAWTGTWNQGTGAEEWAFIPPDLLPKLQDMIVNGHEYFVDGDVMAKDIWADGSGATAADGKKQWDEFHTMVIGSEGRGGTHYFALELIFPANANPGAVSVATPSTVGALRKPTAANTVRPFRWIYPQPGTIEATRFGKTLFTLSPKPPPIGPVLIEDSSSFTPTRYGVKAREAWIVMLAGGWAPGLNRGRGIYMVDAYWGLVNGREDNLYWKAEFNDEATGDKDGPLSDMTGSIASPVAMADYGAHDAVAQDGFFDTAVVGDTIGQIWVARFYTPGKIGTAATGTLGNESLASPQATNASVYITRGSPGVVTNWSAGRAFEMDKNANVTSGYKDIKNVQSFFYLPSLAIDPSSLSLRAFIGSGNRYALLEPYSGLCRYDNPMACAKFGCDDIRIDLDIERAPSEIEGQWNRFQDRRMDNSSNQRIEDGPEVRTYCQDNAELNYEDYRIDGCDQESGGDKNYGQVNLATFSCGSQTDFGWGCRPSNSPNRKINDLQFRIDTGIANANGKDRYYGLIVYGAGRSFDETNTGSAPFAEQFDIGRLTDRGSNSSLTNVTNVTCDATNACTAGTAPPVTPAQGWWLEYPNHGMKTATGSAIIASCVVWSSLNPGAEIAGGTEACATSVANSNFYQADFITGEPNCATGFANPDGGSNFRFLTRDVLTPPPEPATIVQISQSGNIRYSAQLPEPGRGTQFQVDVTAGGDVLQSVYELPIQRSTHECRHVQNGVCSPVP